MQSSKNIRRGLVIAVSISVATIVAIFLLTMDHSTWPAIARISPLFLLVALGLALGRWIVTCLRAKLLLKATGCELSTGRTVKAVLAGGFAGAVTPYHAAGIPTEIYFFTVYGVPGGEATAVVTAGAALSILLFAIVMPIVLVLSASRIQTGFGIRALLLTASIIAFFFFLSVVYSMKEPEKLTRFLRESSPRFLRKRPGFNRAIDRLRNGVRDFSESLRSILQSRWDQIFWICFLTLAFWGMGFFVAPVVLWGLGYPDLFWKALLAQLVVSSLLPFMPIPGESGMAEGAFATVFAVFVPKNLVGFVTLSWRFFMFYLELIILGIVFIVAVRDAARLRDELQAERLPEAPPSGP